VKGIVFLECRRMVAERLTREMTDHMHTAAVSSDGAYTAMGTYDDHEIVQLAVRRGTLTSIFSPTLLHPSRTRDFL
jgi:hypothetical protein